MALPQTGCLLQRAGNTILLVLAVAGKTAFMSGLAKAMEKEVSGAGDVEREAMLSHFCASFPG